MFLGKHLANASILCNNKVIYFCLKGGPLHKPYWPPWPATLPHLSDFYV